MLWCVTNQDSLLLATLWYGKTSQFYEALVSLDMSAINIFEHDAMSAHLPIISQPKQQNVCMYLYIHCQLGSKVSIWGSQI